MLTEATINKIIKRWKDHKSDSLKSDYAVD